MCLLYPKGSILSRKYTEFFQKFLVRVFRYMAIRTQKNTFLHFIITICAKKILGIQCIVFCRWIDMMKLKRCWVSKKTTLCTFATQHLNQFLAGFPSTLGGITGTTYIAALLCLLIEFAITVLAYTHY